MTYDNMIATGAWAGRNLELRSRMAEYQVDDTRLGAIDWPSGGSSPDDMMLDRWSNEVLGVALVLGLLSHEGIRIQSRDKSGNKLERPDLDVALEDGALFGVEQADVTNTAQRQHEAESAKLTASIRRLIDSDSAFAKAFGNSHATIFLSSHVVGKHQIASKKERVSLQAEIERFFRDGEHLNGGDRQPFSANYPALHSRGATWHNSSSPIPVFDIGHGATNASTYPAIRDIVRVLNDHRRAAEAYRKTPLWIVLLLTDRWEFLRNTLNEVATLTPPIDPFERCYLTDDSGRVLELRRNGYAVFTGMFAKQ